MPKFPKYVEGLQSFMESWSDDHEGEKVSTHNVLCPTCNGNGTQALHGYDVTEMVMEDPDFGDDYMAGHYDHPCDYCEGAKVLLDFDEFSASQEMITEWNEWMDSLYEMRAIEAAERAAGC